MSEIKNTPKQVEAVRDAIAATLGDALDCTRVRSAWGVGTMSQDDFVTIAGDDNRLQEIAIAALDASGARDLLEALEEIVNAPNIGGKGGLHKARAAIAKARGAA